MSNVYNLKSTVPNKKHGGGSIMLQVLLEKRLQEIDNVMMKDGYLEILKRQLTTSSITLTLLQNSESIEVAVTKP